MTPQAGRVLRRIAYLLEAVSMVGLVMVSKQRIEPRRFAGLDQRQWSLGLAVGLFLWLISTAILYWPRKNKTAEQVQD